MSNLIESYDQQYAVLTADITADIGRLRLAGKDEKKNLLIEIDKHVTEAHELLEQIELEIHEADSSSRPYLRSRLNCYRAELKRLQQEITNAKSGSKNDFDYVEDFSDVSITQDQKRRLLDNSECIERAGKYLNDGYRIALETEAIGVQVLQDLNQQRETIKGARNKLRDTDAELGLSNKILRGMVIRSIQHKVILAVISILFVIVICLGVYFHFK
ncbi:vesicle transport through interaction with t-SNAREs homolog 1A [Ctenocephalides felis]|uniref:vesicle transport through interaction with t-SNAREs homolog 1A n=1 Tax=Ctenocephalides felis TaxID=7515 RepID=UPI000E6E4C73|nr:vesicle transport through interaction with t-SNAREs homolog 1A [Ctenocephalides felis]